jgi:hypothetical protein
MEFVITQGQLTLVPIPGPPGEEGEPQSRSGYLLNVEDTKTGITVRISMGHGHCAQLGQVMVADTSEHPEAVQAASIEVAPASALRALPDPPLAS